MSAETFRSFIIGLVIGLVIGLAVGAAIAIPLSIKYTTEAVIEELKVNPEIIGSNSQELSAQPQPSNQMRYTQKDLHCLAKNIFHEAGVEDMVGKIAVGQVTLNRLANGRWGDTICEVVYAKAQFSWTLSKRLRDEQPKGQLWDESLHAAKDVLNGTRHTQVGNSLFYHTDYIKTPYWVDPSHMTTKIGRHIFYERARQA